jgi:hypothetical protein
MINQIIAGADIHAGDGGYSEGTQEKYDEFVKVRNQSLGKMRIKELMKKAGTDTSGKWMGVEHAEKFAELIVRECLNIVEKNESDMHYDNGMYPVHPTVCEIREHFGVEE